MNQQTDYTIQQRQQHMQLWTRAFTLACVIACFILTVFASELLRVSHRPTLDDAPEKINPNTAPAQSLIRLSGIGKAKALDIIHYRGMMQADRPAFGNAQDMENISGIGPKTVAKLTPYLTFEHENAEQRNTD